MKGKMQKMSKEDIKNEVQGADGGAENAAGRARGAVDVAGEAAKNAAMAAQEAVEGASRAQAGWEGTRGGEGLLEAKNAELTADLQRTRADFENYRKQVEAQKQHEQRLAQLATVMKVLPLLDDVERAVSAYAELAPVAKSLEKTLKELKLERIDSGVGAEFSPELHDAVMVEGEGGREVVAETLRTGYYYEGEVLRPAMVKVRCE